jgi:hypothetical protein
LCIAGCEPLLTASPKPSPKPEPVKLEGKVSVSSEYASYKAAYMQDGDVRTYWRPLTTDTNDREVWISLDFGSEAELSRIEMDMTGVAKRPTGLYLPESYEVKVLTDPTYKGKYGADPSKWRTIASRVKSDYPSGIDSISFESVRARRLAIVFQVEQVGTGTTPAPRLKELQVYGWKGKNEDMEDLKDSNETAAAEAEQPAANKQPDVNLPEPKPVDRIPFDKEHFHIYLFLGQSNMAGRAPLEPQDMMVIERSYLFNLDGRWEPAQPGVLAGSKFKTLQGMNRYSSVEVPTKYNGMNPAFLFAQTVAMNVPDIGIGIVSNAKGGTLIREWEKGTELYNEALRRVKEAMQFGTLKAIMWQQGESDRRNIHYTTQLEKLIRDFRRDLNMEDLPFFVGEVPKIPKVGDPEKMELSIRFNEMLAKMAEKVPGVYLVSSDGFDDIGDGTHIDTVGQRTFGVRFAEQTLKAIYGMETVRFKPRTESVTPTTDATCRCAITFNGDPVSPAEPPFMAGGQLFVPLEEVMAFIGADLERVSGSEFASIRKGEVHVELQIGSENAYINGRVATLDISPVEKNNRLFVPFRFLEEIVVAMGASAELREDAESKTIAVRTGR